MQSGPLTIRFFFWPMSMVSFVCSALMRPISTIISLISSSLPSLSGGEIEIYKAKLRTEFGYSNKDIKADPDLQEMESRIAAFQKRSWFLTKTGGWRGPVRPNQVASVLSNVIHLGLSENRVYSQWNSHLIGIMISKTIGFRGTLFSDTPICRRFWFSLEIVWTCLNRCFWSDGHLNI